MELGKGFWWRLVGIVIGLGVLGFLGFLIFDRLIWRFGAIGALVIIFGILMVIAYRSDPEEAAPLRRRRIGLLAQRPGRLRGDTSGARTIPHFSRLGLPLESRTRCEEAGGYWRL
jgi:hypothetical protein